MMLLHNYFYVCVYRIARGTLRYSIKHSMGTIECQNTGRAETHGKPRRMRSIMVQRKKAIEHIKSNHQQFIKEAYVIKVSIESIERWQTAKSHCNDLFNTWSNYRLLNNLKIRQISLNDKFVIAPEVIISYILAHLMILRDIVYGVT